MTTKGDSKVFFGISELASAYRPSVPSFCRVAKYKVIRNLTTENQGKNKGKIHTMLSSFRASSLANSRPPLAQIWVINLFPMLRALVGTSTRSDDERLKFGLLTALAWLHPAIMKPPAVPREATSAHKSPRPVMTSSRTSTSFLIHSSAPGISLAERLVSSDVAPTELKILLSRAVHWLANSKHLSFRALRASLSFVFFSISTLSVAFKALCSWLSRLEFYGLSVW
jgi:hypothetical protein